MTLFMKYVWINPLKNETNPICHLLALLEAHHILHISRIWLTWIALITNMNEFIKKIAWWGVTEGHYPFGARINFLILAHPVYKMWIIQEPNMLELWNKLDFEEKKTESIYHV